jgi:hypothetical protein
MKRLIQFLLIFHFLVPFYCPAQVPKYSQKNLVGAFDGRSPCQELAKQLQELTIPECIKIKWRLILYNDSVTGGPGTFILWGYIYRNESAARGKWHIIKGTRVNPTAIVYQIDLPGKDPLFFQRGDENVLFFLDKEKNLMVGNRDFSYTLNRIDNNN